MAQIENWWQQYQKYQKENEDPRLRGFLEESILPSIAIMVFYPILVKILIPKFMERRKPYHLKSVILIYNIFQVTVSGSAAYFLLTGITQDETSPLFCTPLDRTSSGDFIAKVLQVMYYVRLSDLIETIFYALRKKERQLSFLHVYHHMGNIMMGWLSVRFLPGGTACSVNGFNFAVHFLMYLYYLSVSHGSPAIRKFALKYKYCMTRIQIVQLIAIIWVVVHDAITPRCQNAFLFDTYVFGHVTLVFFLFLDFYYKTYITHPIKLD